MHILTKKEKHPHQCLQKCANIQNCYSNRAYMHDYCSCANDFFILFFFSLPLHLALPLCLLLTIKSPLLNHQSLSSSNNKITKSPLPSLNHRSRWCHPNTKTQKLKLAITHHNTKIQKLKLAITHHRISNELDEIKLQN